MLCQSICTNGFLAKVTHGQKNVPLLLNAAPRPTSWYVLFPKFHWLLRTVDPHLDHRVVPLLWAALSSRYTALDVQGIPPKCRR
jgi:hypothetical protein